MKLYYESPPQTPVSFSGHHIPIVGLPCMIEVEKKEGEVIILCVLCNRKLTKDNFLAHLQTIPHVLKFLEKCFPPIFAVYNSETKLTSKQISSLVDELKKIENDLGIGRMAVCMEREKSIVMKFIRDASSVDIKGIYRFIKTLEPEPDPQLEEVNEETEGQKEDKDENLNEVDPDSFEGFESISSKTKNKLLVLNKKNSSPKKKNGEKSQLEEFSIKEKPNDVTVDDLFREITQSDNIVSSYNEKSDEISLLEESPIKQEVDVIKVDDLFKEAIDSDNRVSPPKRKLNEKSSLVDYSDEEDVHNLSVQDLLKEAMASDSRDACNDSRPFDVPVIDKPPEKRRHESSDSSAKRMKPDVHNFNDLQNTDERNVNESMKIVIVENLKPVEVIVGIDNKMEKEEEVIEDKDDRKVMIHNLPKNLSQNMFSKLMNRFGVIESIVGSRNKPTLTITFSDRQSAIQIHKEWNGKCMFGNKVLVTLVVPMNEEELNSNKPEEVPKNSIKVDPTVAKLDKMGKIYYLQVTNLPKESTKNELKKLFEMKIILEDDDIEINEEESYALICMKEISQVETCIETFNNFSLKNSTLGLQWAGPLLVKMLPHVEQEVATWKLKNSSKFTKEQAEDVFSKLGEILKLEIEYLEENSTWGWKCVFKPNKTTYSFEELGVTRKICNSSLFEYEDYSLKVQHKDPNMIYQLFRPFGKIFKIVEKEDTSVVHFFNREPAYQAYKTYQFYETKDRYILNIIPSNFVLRRFSTLLSYKKKPSDIFGYLFTYNVYPFLSLREVSDITYEIVFESPVVESRCREAEVNRIGLKGYNAISMPSSYIGYRYKVDVTKISEDIPLERVHRLFSSIGECKVQLTGHDSYEVRFSDIQAAFDAIKKYDKKEVWGNVIYLQMSKKNDNVSSVEVHNIQDYRELKMVSRKLHNWTAIWMERLLPAPVVFEFNGTQPLLSPTEFKNEFPNLYYIPHSLNSKYLKPICIREQELLMIKDIKNLKRDKQYKKNYQNAIKELQRNIRRLEYTNIWNVSQYSQMTGNLKTR